MQINTKYIKVSGKIEVEPGQSFEMDKDFTIACTGSVVAVQENSNQDGTVDRIYKFKIVTAEIK